MKLVNILAAIYVGAAIQPIVTRPSPDRILITGADYAIVEPFLDVYAVATGTRFMYTLVWEDGTIEYVVNPEQNFTVKAFAPDDPATPEIDRQQYDFTMDVTAENRLDWIVYNRITWEQKMRTIIEDEGLSFFDVSESVARVQIMLDTAP